MTVCLTQTLFVDRDPDKSSGIQCFGGDVRKLAAAPAWTRLRVRVLACSLRGNDWGALPWACVLVLAPLPVLGDGKAVAHVGAAGMGDAPGMGPVQAEPLVVLHDVLRPGSVGRRGGIGMEGV